MLSLMTFQCVERGKAKLSTFVFAVCVLFWCWLLIFGDFRLKTGLMYFTVLSSLLFSNNLFMCTSIVHPTFLFACRPII